MSFITFILKNNHTNKMSHLTTKLKLNNTLIPKMSKTT